MIITIILNLKYGVEKMTFYVIASIILILYLVFRVVALEGRLKQLQSSLSQVRDYPEIEEHPVNDELRTLIQNGENVKAVKRSREAFGFSLLEGKEYIDKLTNEIQSH